MRSSLLVAACWCGLIGSAIPADSLRPFHQPVEPPRAVQVIAHRGLRSSAPENSVEAVRECAVDFIEWAAIDVRRTKDGHHVALHEGALPAAGQDGNPGVADFTLEQVRGLDTGARFAPRFQDVHPVTLAQLFHDVGRSVNLVLHCVGVGPAQLVHEVRAAEMQSRVAVAGPPEFLRQMRNVAGDEIARVADFHPQDTAIEQFLEQFHPAAVTMSAGDVTPDLCRELHARGVRIHANTVGTLTDCHPVWTRVLECGVDGITTDNPAGVRFCEVRRRIPEFPVQIACHRGANRYAPENTLPAIELAAELGADYIEIDIRTTQDGKFVLLHDGSLDRTTNGSGPVEDQTAAAVAALDAGSWFGAPFAGLKVPMLDQGLQAIGPRSQAYLDAKDIAPEALLAAIRAHGLMDRHAVYAAVDYCRRLKELEPGVRLMPPLRNPDDLPAVAELAPYCVDANWSKLSKDLIDRCHTAGIKVFSDALGEHETVDDYRQAMDWGIDLIQTDYPLRVLRAIELEAASNEGKNRR